ncbi:hypothetical protein [Caulobacter sp. NIBR2454]|uniref:hypothetical protein n=1 Tax=Caulobacter sp. NIBR2454 TaxID=3015996 RepID=UPI002FC3CE67
MRRKPGAPWVLDLASEDRARALQSAEDCLAEGRAAAVRVTKETLDEETREFQTVTIMSKGAVMGPDKKKKVDEDRAPLCVSPADLYSAHARERIGRLLDGYLARHKATPFELLHRPDLVENLEASVELQHAIQKISIPEAEARGLKVHDVMKTFQGLAQRAIERLLKDFKKGKLPDVDREGFAAAAERLVADPDRAYLLGAGVAASIAPAHGWADKITRLLDLADAAPQEPKARAMALAVIEQPICEILNSAAGLNDLLGSDMDLGSSLAAMTRLAGSEQVEMLIGIEPRVAAVMPALEGPAARLANWLGSKHFEQVRKAISQRVLKELTSPKRLKPGDAEAEIEYLRALAMALTAAAGRILEHEDIHNAFTERSKMLLTGEFVTSLLGRDRSAREEIEVLVKLTENVTGGANKRAASRWLLANATGLRFEREIQQGPDAAAAKLAALATLQRLVSRSGLVPEDYKPIQDHFGQLGARIESETRVINTLLRAPSPLTFKLSVLIRLATGETGPIGPAADKARAEALKLVRMPESREALAKSPQVLALVRSFVESTQKAA